MYRYGRYPIPNDDTEAGREGLRHALFKELLDGRLHLAPIDEYPQKILDIGTGFGDWAMESMALSHFLLHHVLECRNAID